jgi:signal peptide peptidase SppA
MSQLLRVIEALYCDPWVIRADFLPRLCRIVDEHASDLAHASGGCASEYADKRGREDPERPRGLKLATATAAPRLGTTAGGQTEMKIAILEINGVIGRKFSSALNSSGVVSIDVLEALVERLAADGNIAAIVLDFESPGGHSLGVGDVAESISRATASKPVVAFSGGMMCSAAYWLAAPADAIVVGATAVVGSIGVYTVFLDTTRYYENLGVQVELIKQGRLKGLGIEGTRLSDEGRKFLQARVDKVYQQFAGAVTANRMGVTSETMQGQYFDGQEAIERKLADRIGTLNDAIRLAAEMAQERQETRR